VFSALQTLIIYAVTYPGTSDTTPLLQGAYFPLISYSVVILFVELYDLFQNYLKRKEYAKVSGYKLAINFETKNIALHISIVLFMVFGTLSIGLLRIVFDFFKTNYGFDLYQNVSLGFIIKLIAGLLIGFVQIYSINFVRNVTKNRSVKKHNISF
jgi:hypothetical protein